MKRIIFLYLLSVLLVQCRKGNSPAGNAEIKDVTGINWQLFGVQKTNDPFINPIPTDWSLQLKDDRTFFFNLHNVNGTGTYSWVQADSLNAGIRFSIQNWNFPATDTQYTNRLKIILQNVDSCHYLKPPNVLPVPFYPNPAKMELEFSGAAGWFYVFRF